VAGGLHPPAHPINPKAGQGNLSGFFREYFDANQNQLAAAEGLLVPLEE
jgi:hypothetical protein